MKKVLLAALVVMTMISGAYASGDAKVAAKTVAPTHSSPVDKANEATFEKQGFLTTKWCAEQGLFADCRLESVVCGEGGCFQNWEFDDKMKTELVVYVLDDLQYYEIKPTEHINMAELIEEGISRNLVTIKGNYDAKTNTIVATEFKAPPPPKKSFFKGCL